MPRIQIDNPAADSELSTRGDLCDAVITGGRESFEKLSHVRGCSAPELNNRRFKRAAPRRSLIETCACRDDDARAGVSLDLQKQRQPFSDDLRIGQNIFDSGQLGFWQEQRVRLPIEQTLVKYFLRMNAGGENPNRGIGSLPVTHRRDYGSQERLRRLDHVRKLDRPLGPLYRGKFARDWVARSDPL